MEYLALATDYDGTLARHGEVSRTTLDALQRFQKTGRKVILVTGRELFDLKNVFPELDSCDYVVAENGALLYVPRTGEKRALAAPPKPAFIEALRQRGVKPLSVGATIVATCEPYQTAVLQVIHEQGLELQVIFNKGSVMVLPSGVNTKPGLEAALKEMGIAPERVVGVGDAENDHAFLEYCGWSVAVANALPAVKETADFTTRAGHGDGVAELIEMILANEFAGTSKR
jgi:HAD superfamily hydrolase (TIGR01484 family)